MCIETCIPDCDGKQCGPDGCGGVCGMCAEGFLCEDFVCKPDAAPAPETCGEIQLCIDQCGDDESCASSCFEAAPPEAQQLFFELMQCYQEAQESCDCDEDDDACRFLCALDHCGDLVDECHEWEGDCDDIWTCIQGCDSDPCMKSCVTTIGDSEAKIEFMELVHCIEETCAEGYQGCHQEAVEGECAPLLEVCTGGGCEPDCDGKECGDDSCSGSCGECDDNEACDEGQCVPVEAECTPGAYRQCVDDVLYWFDSCDQRGPPAEVCEVACVEDQCVDDAPVTGDVIEGTGDAGPDSSNGDVTVFPSKEVSSGCTRAPAGTHTAGWLLLLALAALRLLARQRVQR